MGLWSALRRKTRLWKVWRTLEIGTYQNSEALRTDLDRAGVYLSAGATNVLSKTVLTPDRQVLKLVVVSVKNLGFSDNALADALYERALNSGLKLCPPETGFLLGLKGDVDENVYIAMKPALNWQGDSVILKVYKANPVMPMRVKSEYIFSFRYWYNDQRFVFVVD